MKRRLNLFIISLMALLVHSCQEEYFVDLKDVETALVVEGYISDKGGIQSIRLSYASKFQSVESPVYAYGANVILHVSDGTTWEFHPGWAGYYNLPADFLAEPGKTYTLEIQLTGFDGEPRVYQSIPQAMPSPVNIDDAYAEFSEELFFFYSTETDYVYQRYVPGTNAMVTASNTDGSPVRFRFESEMYLQYVIRYDGVIPSYDYCWIRRDVTDFAGSDINLFPNQQNSPTRIAFIPSIPFYMGHLGFPRYPYDGVRVIINRMFTLNEQGYKFHKDKNEQLGDNGQFFDPIASQVKGNIKCISHPDELVLGFFEVSSEITRPYLVNANEYYNILEVDLLDLNFDLIPRAGCKLDTLPDFWLP
ncbi:MAG: DUF4249 domain-containing protein [Bacteroidales bacterium]|nr:DUF4249 domain-containing protein [Bacteroidales bacterium]